MYAYLIQCFVMSAKLRLKNLLFFYWTVHTFIRCLNNSSHALGE